MKLHPLDLNLRHLRAVAAITAHGSISLAAQAENLSQPALTQGIGKLERQIGVALFARRADGVRPTDAGLALSERVVSAFSHLTATGRAVVRGRGRGFSRPEQLITATQLRAFLTLAEAGSFVAAAAALHQSQPSLHRAVRDLEGIFAVALVERRGRGVALTQAGRRLARGARLAVREIEAGLAEALPDHAGADRLAIGAMPLCRALVLPHAIAVSAREGTSLAIDVREGSWRELIEPLRDGEIDLTIGALRPDPLPGLTQTALFEDRLAVVARRGHPLAGQVEPSLDQLGSYGWIVAPPGAPLRAHWEALFARRPLPAAPIECGSVMVIRGVLGETDLLTLLSSDQVALEVASGMLALIGAPLAEGVRTIGVTTRADWRPTPAQARFLAHLDRAVASTRLSKAE